MAYRKRLLSFLVLLGVVLAVYLAPLLPTFYFLLRLPFVWKELSAQSLISSERDGFDLTFSNLSANNLTESGLLPLVPARVHHIHLGSRPTPTEWISARAKCLAQHESWEPFLWDDETASEFVKKHYPHLYGMWKNYPFMVQRVDALRYMVLDTYGGAILDYDLVCKRSLEPLRQFEFVAPAAHPTGFSVGMMLSAPNTSFTHALVHNLPRFNHRWLLLPYATVMFSTGCHYAS
ncbi:hypothetical protein BDW67DRAFT_180760 [Aspergillus spinulosporus]